jgi:hypothetical protein
MSSNPIASAIFCTDKALIIQGFVVSGVLKKFLACQMRSIALMDAFHNSTCFYPSSASCRGASTYDVVQINNENLLGTIRRSIFNLRK